MQTKNILLITRAVRFSPGKGAAGDKAIMDAVAGRLAAMGLCCDTCSEEQLSIGQLSAAAVCASMGRDDGTLRLLSAAEQMGATVLNATAAVRLCNHRGELTELLEREGIPVPPTTGSSGYWVKRADACSQQSGDVVFAATAGEAETAARQMKTRGIGTTETRANVDGRHVKFYGVSGTGFFRQYTDSSQAFDCPALETIAARAAQTAGLDIYGGDCIVRPDGSPVIVDLNDWPSFAPCRDDAAMAIADRIVGEIERLRE